ncbi:hypothetical protein IIA95_03465 [Patescibacteria group bacterium]|nr:hypothetical protein [Patescibacteria group bacterium]
MNQQATPNEKELAQNLELNAKKLAILLYNSTMPSDIKDAWIALLPKMSTEQIDQLFNILEAKYLDGGTKDIDEKYRKELEKVVKDFEKERDEDHEKLIKQIKQIR